jgi:DMSO/TMAO reductase YedYZ molybdopterin-dependent catalytic subunit
MMGSELQGIKGKRVAAKQAWARAGRLLTGASDAAHANRLPPGQRLVTNWPVLDLGIQPDVTTAEWLLTIDGAVANPVEWDWRTLMTQPLFEDVSDMHCVTQWSKYNNHWQGVSIQHLLSVVLPLPEAVHVVLHGYDGYATNVRLDHFAQEDCLLAHTHDGVPIAREHGGPVRVILPRWYLWKSAKWLNRLEFLACDQLGFWKTRGYHNEGDPWMEQRYG